MVSIGMSHPSLSGYTLNFYNDKNLNLSLIQLVLLLQVLSVIQTQIQNNNHWYKKFTKLFYRIEGLGNNYTNTFPSSVYTETENQPKISFVK